MCWKNERDALNEGQATDDVTKIENKDFPQHKKILEMLNYVGGVSIEP